tara:strand:- start:121 stop:258 length:138 start_codon:yes stop_codon:yes gene_type:complete
MTDFVFKDINLVNFGCATDADRRFSWESTDLVDGLKAAISPKKRN